MGRRAGGREMYVNTSNGGSKGVAGRALDMLVSCFRPCSNECMR